MDRIYEWLGLAKEFSSDTVNDTWNWFNGLNREEWMVTLTIGAAVGFVLMMLGFGNRK